MTDERDSWLVTRLKRGYGCTLAFVLCHTRPVVVAAVLLLAMTVLSVPFLGRGFLPEF